jgi:hypothetical protein
MILGLVPALTTNIVPVQAQAADCTLRHSPYDASIDPFGLTYAESPFCIFLHPGIADAYLTGWSHTLGTLKGVEAGAPQTQQVFDKYLDYSILASASDSIGDLQFDFNIPAAGLDQRRPANVSAIDIFVPPEFVFKGATPDESVWSDITNDYAFITVSTLDQYDKVAPGWTLVEVGSGGDWNITSGIYHIRLMDLSAPTVAGLYFFKIAYYDTAGTQYFVSAADYPFVVVKTDLNPAIVTVTVRTDGHTAPPFASGRVIAMGTTPEGRTVAGATYWGPLEFVDNSTVAGNVGAEYTTWLFGLAAGTYTLTAEASGFLPTTTDRITLDPGQSYHIYIVVYYSPEVSVTVWSKHGTGALPWNNLWQLPYGTNNPDLAPDDTRPWRDIMLELYDSDNNMIAYWASDVFGLNDTAGSIYLGPLAGSGLPGAAQYTDVWPGGVLQHPGQSPALLHSQSGDEKEIAATTKLLGYHDDEAPRPTAVSYSAKLCDNFDVLGFMRMYPSTHWDGHVPWMTADYVAGYAKGDYTVEGFVTGYIMDEADAYQRAFTVLGSNINLQFDLRRSNWLDISMHLPANTFLSAPTTVTLTASDAADNERGALAFTATNAMSRDGLLDGSDGVIFYNTLGSGATLGVAIANYTGGLVIEGYNGGFPNFDGDAPDITYKDYGLNPTASTHSAGAVTLAGNPYTVKLYMADMGIPAWPSVALDPISLDWYPVWNQTGWYSIDGGDPQASIYLCNSRVALSFSITNAMIWISLRSTDFEIPAHSRPWTFPGSEIYVDFTDTSTGDVVDSLSPSLYGLFQDPGWLNTTFQATENTYWGIVGVNYNANGVADPSDYRNHGFGWTPYDVDNINAPGQHEHLGVWYFGTDYGPGSVNDDLFGDVIFAGDRSTRLPPGEYTYEASTHGYVMRRSFPFQIPQSGIADIEADMIQGGQIRVTVDFWHEGIPTAFHGFIYAEAYDSAGNFVGASIYGQAQPNWYDRIANGGGYLEYNGWPINPGDPNTGAGADWMVVQGPAQAAGLNYWNGTGDAGQPVNSQQNAIRNYGPTSATAQHYLLNCTDHPSCSYAQAAFRAWDRHTELLWPETMFPNATWAGAWGDAPMQYTVPSDYWFAPNRVDMAPGDAQSMDMYGFYGYYGNAIRTWAGGWPVPAGGDSAAQVDSGMKGTVDVPGWAGSGAGLYTVKVWAFDSRGPDNTTASAWAPDRTGVTHDDWRMYAMGAELTNVQVPWGGAVELYVPMNDMATLTGTVRWFDMYGNLRSLAWAQVTASPGPSTDTYPAYQTSSYIMWLPAGTHDVSVSTSEAPQVWTSAAPTVNDAFTVVVSDGWAGTSDAQLSTSGTPVPEVPAFAAPLALFAVLAASVWLLRKKNYNIPVLMK